MRSWWCGLLALVALPMMGGVASLAASQAPPIPLDVPRFEMYGAHGTNVEVRYVLGPSGDAGREDDPGPHVVSGTVAIVSGPNRTDSLFTFAQLGMVQPNVTQIVPKDVKDACGAFGPIDIEPLAGFVAPAAVVVSVAVGKGCEPIVHTFLPVGASSRTYARVSTYEFPGIGTPQHARPSAGKKVFTVVSVRTFALAQSPPGMQMRGARIAVVTGTDRAGKRSTIAFDFRTHADPTIGSTYVLAASPNGFEGVATPLAQN